MANTAIITSIANLMREEIGPTVFEMLPSEIDPAFEDFEITSDGVKRFADISRGWLMRMTCSSGLAGAMKWVDPAADKVGTNSSRHHTNATQLPSNRFPSAAGLPLKSIIQFEVPLAKAMGNLAWPLEFLRAEKMSASLAKYTELNIEGEARMIALHQAQSFFAPVGGETGGVLAFVNGTPGSTGDSDGIVTCDVDNGRLNQFQDGMLVDIYRNSGGDWTQVNLSGTAATRGVVDGVNYLADNDGTACDALRIVFDGTLDEAVADNDLIVLKDSHVDPSSGNDYSRTGPLGLDDMIKAAAASTYLMSPNNSSSYGIELANYPSYGSLVEAIDGVLDEDTLNKWLGIFFDATGLPLDTALTTRGVKNKLYEYPTVDSGRQVTDRTGRVRQYTMGRDDLKMAYEGRNFRVLQSRFCRDGLLYVLQRSGNYKIAVPPRQPGTTGKDTQYGAPFELVGKALGYNNDFIPVHSGDSHTEMVEAPFVLHYQIVAEKPQGIKLTGITEN